MARTPWTNTSSLTSDRLKPRVGPAHGQGKTKTKTKGSGAAEPPKSAAVMALERIISDLEAVADEAMAKGKAKDNGSACYCQARTHALSTYTPLCSHCALVLCEHMPPHAACPHCGSPLLRPAARQRLIDRLRAEVASTLQREADEEARRREEVHAREGAFPLLGAAAPPPPAANSSRERQPQQPHKVLSLNTKTKRVTVASYTPSPPRSGAASPAPPALEDAVDRGTFVPAPSREPQYANAPPPKDRPWLDVRGDGRALALGYVPDPEEVRERLKMERKERKDKERALRAANEARQ